MNEKNSNINYTKNIFQVFNVLDSMRENRCKWDSSSDSDSDSCHSIIIDNIKLEKEAELNKNDPDYQIELFWYGFKTSMLNFFCAYKLSYNQINEWSETLNNFKKNKNYDEIECCIRDYMSQYAIQLARQKTSNYHDQIFISNIKRWDKISNKYKFTTSEKYNKIIMIFYICNDIKNDIKNDKETNSFHIIKNIDYINSTNDFTSIIQYATSHNKSKILERLRSIPGYDIIDDIKQLYPGLIIQDKNIKMNKICVLIKKHNEKY